MPGTAKNSDSSYSESVPAGGVLNIPDITASNSDDSYSVEVPAVTDVDIPDTPYTNSDGSVSGNLPSCVEKVFTNVPYTDSDGSIVDWPALKPVVCTPAVTPSGWYPPSYWPSGWGDDLTDTDDGFIALVAVYPNTPNYISFRMYYTGGGGTIDWGDGTTQALAASTVTNETTLNYAGVSGTPNEQGYKIAVVKIKITGTLTGNFFSTAHSVLGVTDYASTPYLAIKVRSQNATFAYSHYNPYRAASLEWLDLGAAPLSALSFAFYGHTKLKYCTFTPPTYNVTGDRAFAGYSFYGGHTLLDSFDFDNDIDWSKITNMTNMFYATMGTPSKFEQSIPLCTSLYYTFGLSGNFKEIILKDTGNVTTIQYMCLYTNVEYISLDDCSSVTNTTQIVVLTYANNNLQGLILTGLTVGIDLSNCKMQATALDAFFSALGTASGSQTITVTGNPGAATCNTAIATAKGFTVVT